MLQCGKRYLNALAIICTSSEAKQRMDARDIPTLGTNGETVAPLLAILRQLRVVPLQPPYLNLCHPNLHHVFRTQSFSQSGEYPGRIDMIPNFYRASVTDDLFAGTFRTTRARNDSH